MNCPSRSHENRELLADYVAGNLAPERAAALERHLESCVECTRFVEEQRLVWDAMDQWEPQPVSADFNRRLYHAIDREQPARWFERLLGPLWRPVLPLAAACLLIVAGLVLHAPQAAVPVDSRVGVEPEQVERTLDDMQMLRELMVTPAEGEKTSNPL